MADGSQVKEAWAEVAGIEPPGKGVAQWIWEVLQGDFAQERSAAQIATDMVISLIPIVDTICDIRDLCANVRAYRKDPSNKLTMFFIALTVVGFIPEVGSIVKGVVKIVFAYLRRYIKHVDELFELSKLARLTERAVDSALPKISQVLSNARILKWATRNRVPNVYKFVAKELLRITNLVSPGALKKHFDEGVALIEDLLGYLRLIIPGSAYERISETLGYLEKQKSRIGNGIQQFAKPINTILRIIAKKLDDHAWVALTQNTNKGWIAPITQEGATALMRRRQPRWARLGKELPHEGYSSQAAKDLARKLEAAAATAKREKKAFPTPLSADIITTFKDGTLKAAPIKGPTKLYRIVDPTSAAGGSFWVDEKTFKSLRDRAEWREKLAVKPEWNQNGSFVVYEVPAGETLQVWKGTAASQKLDGTDYYLAGGAEQIVFSPKPDTMQFGQARIDQDTGGEVTGRYGVDKRIEFKDVTGRTAATPIRGKINDPHIKGPFETGWGYADWTGDQARGIYVALPDDTQ